MVMSNFGLRARMAIDNMGKTAVEKNTTRRTYLLASQESIEK
jgi:hypothetical protein